MIGRRKREVRVRLLHTTRDVNNKRPQSPWELTGKQLTSPVHHRRRTAPCVSRTAQMRERMGGERGMGWTPQPHHRRRRQRRPQGSERRRKSSLGPTPPLKNPPLNLLKKTSIFCVCVHMCLPEHAPVFFFFFLFLAWCQMFQLSTAVQHHW